MIAIRRSNFRIVANALASGITLVAIATAVQLPRTLGLQLYPQQTIAIMLSLALSLAFLTRPASRDSNAEFVPWYDVGLAIISFFALLFVAVRYQIIINKIFLSPVEAYLPGGLIIVLLVEGVRRIAGWPLAVFVSFFCLFSLSGEWLPEPFQTQNIDWRILSGYMAFDSNGILGIPLMIAATMVTAFVLFGHVLNRSGGSSFFMDAAYHLVGRYRGGAMKSSVLASGLFGSVSGSAVANVMATGVVTIPIMKKANFPAYKAAAVEAAASTGGQLMPPVMGAAAFLMAEYLQLPYAEVVIAALVPALLYYAALFIQVDLEAAKAGYGSVKSVERPAKRKVLGGLHFLLGFGMLLFCLFTLHWAPEQAALAATLSLASTALLFGYDSDKPGISHLLTSLISTGHAVVEILLISAAAGIVIGVLNLTGLGFTLSVFLVQLGGSSLPLLLGFCAAICILLGMGLPTLGVYVLLATLVAPALVKAGIEPLAAHLFVIYFGMMSMITPPIALAVFAAKAIADAPTYKTGLAAMKFGWVAYLVPFLFVLSPALILKGEFSEIIVAVSSTAFGVWLVSIGLSGHLLSDISKLVRFCFIVLGGLSLLPASLLANSEWLKIGAFLGGLVLMGYHVQKFRQSRTPSPDETR